MNADEAAKMLDELGLDGNKRIAVEMSMTDTLMLSELISSAQAWRAEWEAGTVEDPKSQRLADAIDAYNVAEARAGGLKDGTSD